jgi:hypothetical protein
MLGHSRVDMTRRYTHVLADRQRVAADRMSDVLFGIGTVASPVRRVGKLSQKLCTSRSGRRAQRPMSWSACGDDGTRTHDPLRAKNGVMRP